MEKAVIFISSSTLHPLQSIGNKPPEQPVGRVFSHSANLCIHKVTVFTNPET